MSYYRKKPVEIEAKQFVSPAEGSRIAEWCGGSIENSPDAIDIRTLEGTMRAELGDWIIRGVKGEFYPCKSDIFEATPVTAGWLISSEGSRRRDRAKRQGHRSTRSRR